MTRKILTGAALGIVVLLIAGATIYLRTADRQPKASDVVRVTLGDRSYAIPADWQPTIVGAPSSLRDRILVDGHYQYIYLQSPDDPSPSISALALEDKAIADIARGDERFVRLDEVLQLVIESTPRSIQEYEQSLEKDRAGATLEPGGVFLRKQIGERDSGSFFLYSRVPLLFGSSVKAECGPRSGTTWCSVYGRISQQSWIRITLTLDDYPVSKWPELFETVESFVATLTITENATQ